jgi:hypothetical protein
MYLMFLCTTQYEVTNIYLFISQFLLLFTFGRALLEINFYCNITIFLRISIDKYNTIILLFYIFLQDIVKQL